MARVTPTSADNCFSKAGLTKLSREFKAAVSKGVSPKQAAIEIANRYISEQHKGLHTSLNELKKAAGLQEGTISGVANPAEAVNQKYDALIKEARAVNEKYTSLIQKARTQESRGKSNKRAHTAGTAFVQSADVLRKVEGTQVPPPSPPPASSLLHMTEGSGSTITSSPSTIADKVGDEIELRNASVSSGVSMYSNPQQLALIKDSIEKRIGQVKALLALYPQLSQVRNAHSLPELPATTAQELATILDVLRGLEGVTNALTDESKANTASADMKVAQAVSHLLSRSMSSMDSMAGVLAGTEFSPIRDIVAKSRGEITAALEASKPTEALRLMNIAESAIYNQFPAKRADILKLFSQTPYSPEAVSTYDYVRGILSLPSSDFWNTYHSVLVNSSGEGFSPSDEHSIIVKQAVQGLMADGYSPPSALHPNQVLHNNSVFIEGRGGTAKTKTIVPLIAGIVQHLTGGKVFLTAANDTNDFKRTTLLNAVESFYRVSDKQLGISLASSSKSILELLDTPGATTDINLIVYDEGTLLTTSDLAAIQSRVDRLNRQRRESNSPLLKVLYTGDTLQNSVGVNKADPDARAIGIDDPHRHVIQRTPALTFSFRQSNQQLTLFSSYLEGIQKEKGTSRPFATEYKNREGVQIHQSYPEFVSNAASYLSSLNKQNRLHEAVYITDKGPFEMDQRILDSKVLVMSSENAQGREWPIVFFDPKNTKLFTPDFTNLGVKKDYYTASTRASSYMVTHVTPGQGVTSSEGTVNKVRPLLPERATRAATIERVNQIIGDTAAPVGQVAFDYTSPNIVENGGDFPGFEQPSASDVFTGPVNPLTGRKFQTGEEPPIGPEPVDTSERGEQEPPAGPPVAEPAPLNAGSNIIDYLKSANRKNLVSLHTFFTDALIPFDEQMGLKRKALLGKTPPYFLSINRVGSPGYENVLRNNPEFNGAYALFIEASPGGKHVILGTLSSPGLDTAIKEANLLQGREAIRFPLSEDFLQEIENTGTTLKKTADKKFVMSLGQLKTASEGVQFGDPYIVTVASAETNIEGEPKAKRGDIFIPTTFFYNRGDIDPILKANNTSAYISKTPVRKRIIPFQEVAAVMEGFVHDGKFSMMSEDGLSGRMYDAFWSHNAESGEFGTGKSRENRLSAAFEAIRNKTSPNDPLYNFLDKYVDKPLTQDADEIIAEIRGQEGVTVTKNNDNARYFLKHYLEARDKGHTRNLQLFERAVSALGTHPYFRLGFEFNPRVLWKSTKKGINTHAKAQSLPEEVYNRYLEIAGVQYVSPPSIQLPLNHLLNSIKDAVPQEFKGSIAAEQGRPEPEEEAASKAADAEAMDRLRMGQSEVEYTEPTSSLSATAVTTDDSVVSDSADDKTVYEDDREDGDIRDDVTLDSFQEHWFSKPGYSYLFPQTVRTFRRNFMDYVFATNAEDGAQPFLRDINTVVRNVRARAKELNATFTDDYLSKLDPVNDPKERELYIRGVQSREFPFLLKKYFPAIWQDPETKEYLYRSRHYKERSFSEKESFNLLAEGTTDMVKTMLYNTPVLSKVSEGVFRTTRDYVWQGDIESLVEAAQGSTSTEEIAAHFRTHPSQAVQSVYYRYLHSTPYKVDGKTVWPIGKIPNVEVFKMRDSVAQMALSGEIYDLTKVDLDEKSLNASWGVYGNPNNVRDVARNSVLQVAASRGKLIQSGEGDAMIMESLTVRPSSVALPNDTDVLAAIHAIGLTTFTAQNLHDVQELDYSSFNIAPSPDAAQKVNNKIIDEIILPTMRMMQQEKPLPFRAANILYDAMVRTSGVSNMLMQMDVAGNKSYRYRWGGPIHRVNTQIEEIREPAAHDVGSVHIDNLIARKDPLYKIEATRVKNGFQSWRKSKVVSKMSAKEMADFDVIWSFAEMLKNSHQNSGEYRLAMFTPMVWSDSPTDHQMIVSTKHSLFTKPELILSELFNSRKSFYQLQSSKILTTWNDFLGDRHRAESLRGLSTWLSSNPILVTEVAAHPGMVNNLYYTAIGDNATIKPSLIADVQYYSGDNLKDFVAKSKGHFNALLEFSDNSKNPAGESMTKRLGEAIEGKSGKQVLEAFYYNWLAFSGEFSNLTAGATQAYKGNTQTKEYIDNTKRNKLQMAPRNAQLFRNYGWKNLWQASKAEGKPLSEELKYEGRKLPRHARVAYVRDIVVPLTLPGSGLSKNQEVYDGATFVGPVTRIMQRHSNSGNHGVYVGAKMKNVTTILDNNRGVTTGVKNAEFLITPELMAKGTPRLINLVRRMHMGQFSTPIQGEGQVLSTPLDYLVSKGMAEDFSNATWERFEDLMDFLVEHGEQDSIITEVIPSSARKMGGDAINEFDADTPFVVGAPVDLVNKGMQLDSSHGVDEIKEVSASQILNAMATNWPNHPLLMRMYNGLAEIAAAKVGEFRTMSKAKRVEYLKAIATETFQKRPDMSYASRVTAPSNSNNFSIDDRQLTKSIIQNLTSELTNDAVLLDFAGGQYVVHPTNGLIHVYDVIRDGAPVVVLKDELTGDEKSTPGRDLKWNGEDGRAEILLPNSVRRKLGIIKDSTTGKWPPLNTITPQYFESIQEEGKKSPRKAQDAFDSFQITLRNIVTRIPATGKHSAVASKVVGFIDDSENSIFVPAELLFVQGADQDDDKGTNFSYELVSGVVPEVDEGFELTNKAAFPDKFRKKARIAGIKNAVVHAMEQILLSPNTLMERNSPVDAAKEELNKVAEKVEASYSFERDSYISHLQMREINQAGMALRGIFSNAMKAYNIMTIAYRAAGVDPTTKGLSTDPVVTERLGALVNAAVDNAKDQLMGKLGIGEHNANMVAYLTMTNGPEGRSRTFQEIHDILTRFAPQMEQIKDRRRYDSTRSFKASAEWNTPELIPLASIEYMGNEVSTLARLAINRKIPSSDLDMVKYRKDVESFVNRQYDTFRLPADFRLISFLDNSEYMAQQIAKYEGLKGRKDGKGIQYSDFNILQVLKDAPHIAAYMQVYLLAHKMASESKTYTVTSRLADQILKPSAQLDDRSIRLYNDMREFTYGLFIDSYLQDAENPTKYDLTSPLGRGQFVEAMGDATNVNRLKARYPANSFAQELTIVQDKKRNWENRESSLLRLPDLQLTSEEKRMQMIADFGQLNKKDRRTMVLYNLITRHTRFGKDSFGTLLSPGDKADFNRFLDKRLDISDYNYQQLEEKFNAFREGKMEGVHNAIPYSSRSETPKVTIEKSVQLAAPSTTPTITQGNAEFLNGLLEVGEPYNTHSSTEEVLDGIATLLGDSTTNPMETAYLKALRQDIVSRQSPDSSQVDQRAKDCS